METLCEQTDRSPLVVVEGGELTISGRSFMDNAVEFYRNLIARIGGMKFEKMDVVVRLDYFNTSSSKCLLELFRTFEKINHEGRLMRVFWYHTPDCPDLEEAGEDYRDLVTGVPFELVEIND